MNLQPAIFTTPAHTVCKDSFKMSWLIELKEKKKYITEEELVRSQNLPWVMLEQSWSQAKVNNHVNRSHYLKLKDGEHMYTWGGLCKF